MNLILPNLAWAQALGRAMEVLRKVFHGVDINACGALRVVATLELIQHALPKMGHGKPPVTRGLHSQQCPGESPCSSVRRASDLVQTPIAPAVFNSGHDPEIP